jgi:aldose 1-epimerase
MSAYVEQISFLGEAAVKGGNDQLEFIVVPGWGSNLISLKSKVKDQQLLRAPESAEEFLNRPMLYGTPVLFPPNRIADGIFSYGSRTYHFELNEKEKGNHIHGFLHDVKWDLAKSEVVGNKVIVETEINTAKYPHILAQFPHPLTIRMTYELEGSTLHKNATVRNDGEETFPWGLGYHTTFRLPIGGGTLDQCRFSLKADKQWILNERLLPTGQLNDVEYGDALKAGINLKGWKLDHAYLSSVAEEGSNAAILEDSLAGVKVIYTGDESFKHWVVYNGDGAQAFICPEPYTWITNAPNLDLPSSLTGVRELAPGQTATAKTQIKVEIF